jgi:hypothetical protein
VAGVSVAPGVYGADVSVGAAGMNCPIRWGGPKAEPPGLVPVHRLPAWPGRFLIPIARRRGSYAAYRASSPACRGTGAASGWFGMRHIGQIAGPPSGKSMGPVATTW